jgi:Protein of unknown function (DUF3431)
MLLHSRSRLLLPAFILAFVLLVLLFRSSPEPLPVRTSAASPLAPAPKYEAGIPKSAGQNYSRTVVIASIAREDTKWLSNLANEPNLSTAVYVVDDPKAPLTVPKNKGHEVMVYLTYIIDHYDRLSDVTMFMHAHRFTWHNNDLLFSDAIEMIQRLSSPKVVRDGYMNLRCHLDPGCPDHIHPSIKDDNNGNIPEAVVIGRAWLELFPDAVAPPSVLSQPCCAQFALSKARIQNLPLDRYISFRRWLLDTDLDDRLSGRVWEYVWQYIFAGVDEFCPVESICYCDGYGICFGSEDRYQEYFAMRKNSRELADVKESMGDDEKSNEEKQIMQVQLTHLDLKMSTAKKDAFLRGESPKNRALEAGREWKEGDGF